MTIRLWLIVMPCFTCNLFIYFARILKITFIDWLFDKLISISNLSDWFALYDIVFGPFSSSNQNNLSNSVKSNVHIAFLLYGENIIFWYDENRKKKIENWVYMKMPFSSLEKVLFRFQKYLSISFLGKKFLKNIRKFSSETSVGISFLSTVEKIFWKPPRSC